MFLSKKTGGASIAGIEWADDGAVAEVPDDLAADLLALDPAEYLVADEPKKPATTKKTAASKTSGDSTTD